MLTADDIRNIQFKKASIGGYRTDEVDNFIDEVVELAEELEELQGLRKENAEIIAKSELLMKKVEEMRSNEDSVSTVLVKSQKEADKTIKEAKKQAAQILKDAQAEAERIVSDATARIVKEKEMLVQITEEAAVIRKKLIQSFERQIKSLEVLPDENEPEKLKEMLDEKYPTKPAEKQKKSAEKKEEAFATIEEAVEDATAQTEDSANAEAAAAPTATVETTKPETEDISGSSETEKKAADAAAKAEEQKDAKEVKDGKIQIDKSKFETRFGKLKFGEDYDVKKG